MNNSVYRINTENEMNKRKVQWIQLNMYVYIS